mmetsp:Transcript_63511/g.112991  ORF Transcript_63511/g.112991 Transcript_63511/m.112991 type:complete len:245 (-) Transcript_63511:119-853(-)
MVTKTSRRSLVLGILLLKARFLFVGPSSGAGRRSECVLSAVTERTALELLGLSHADSPAEADIKRAFKQRARKLHPDRGGSKEDFMAVVEAYGVLSGKIPAGAAEKAISVEEELRKRAKAREDVFKEDGKWRWNAEQGYNPNDADTVWDSVGYNPYTGEYHEPREQEPELDEEWSAPRIQTSRVKTYSDMPRGPPPMTVRQLEAERKAKLKNMSSEEILQISVYALLTIVSLSAAIQISLGSIG